MCRRFLVFVLVLGLAGNASAGLVGYWALDGDATDLSDFGNHGNINGNVAPATDRFGNPSGAMSFAGGSGDNIDVGNQPEFNLTGAMTITAWVYLDSTSPVHEGRNGRIVGKMNGGGNRSWSTGIEKNVAGVPLPATIQVSSNGDDVIGIHEPTLPIDQWVHFAGVYTPGTSLEIYLNGVRAGIRTNDIPASQFSDNGRAPLIGNRPACGDCGWYGFLDEVRIYNEALTEAQVKAIMPLRAMAAPREAHSPQPGHRAVDVPVDDATLSWKTGVDLEGDPNNPNPAITGHYLWLSPPYDPADPPSDTEWWADPQIQSFFIGADTNPADGQVDEIAGYKPVLQRDAFYYWAVDESLGASGPSDYDNLILGNTWSFESITSGPVVDAGSNIVTWLKEGTTTVDLNGTVTDDTMDVTATTWSVVSSPPDSTVDIADTSATVTTVTLTETGQYVLQLHAVDAKLNEDSDQMEINVYADSCEAAQNNPNGYTAPSYDFTDDCHVDFTDFAMFSLGWLEDASLTEDALYD